MICNVSDARYLEVLGELCFERQVPELRQVFLLLHELLEHVKVAVALEDLRERQHRLLDDAAQFAVRALHVPALRGARTNLR